MRYSTFCSISFHFWNVNTTTAIKITSAECDFCPQTGVVREESKLLAMMPLTGTNKANRTLLYSIQAHVRGWYLFISWFIMGKFFPIYHPDITYLSSKHVRVVVFLSSCYFYDSAVSPYCLHVQCDHLSIYKSLILKYFSSVPTFYGFRKIRPRHVTFWY